MRKLKIAYLSNNTSIHDWRILKKVVAAGHKVYLFTFHDLNNKRLPELYPYIHSDVMCKIRSIEGLEIVRYFKIRYTKSKILKYLNLLLHLIIGPLMVRYYVNKYKCDILDGNFIQRDGIVAAASGIKNFLLTTSGSDVLVLPRKSVLMKLMATFTIRRAKLVYSDSVAVRKEVLRLGGIDKDKTVVFPHLGIDTDQFDISRANPNFRRRLGIDDGEKVIISIRALRPIYNIPMLISATKYLEENTDVPFRVLVIGRGDTKEEVKNLIKQLGLEKRVIMPGYIDNNLLPEYLASSDIGVSASNSDGTALSLLESMACGLPVVLTDVPSYREWIEEGKGGFIVPLNDSKAMAFKLKVLLEDENLARKMGSLNRRIAKERAEINMNYKKLEKCYNYVASSDLNPPRIESTFTI